jgi:hypothetical protein
VATAVKGLGTLLTFIGVIIILVGLGAALYTGVGLLDQDVTPFYAVGIGLTLIGWLISKH